MRVEKDFEEFIALLNRHRVKYLVVGAYALSYHAQPRNTGDMDFFVKRDPENARRLVRVLHEFGFGGLGIEEQDLLKPDLVVQLGVEPNRIDILSSITAVEFDDAYHSRVGAKFGRSRAWFISFADLLKNKRAIKRKKDQADVEVLLRARKFRRKRRET